MRKPSLVAWVSGPLTAIPNRKVIARSVQRGEAVENPADVANAIAWATWIMRRYRWGFFVFGVLGVLSLVLAIVAATTESQSHPLSWGIQLVLGIAWIVFSNMYRLLWMRARRSVTLNRAISG